jgi:outer membrane lipoprotein SlyB
MGRLIVLGLSAGLFLAPLGAMADSNGAVTGAAGGAVTGAIVGGPVGAAVGAGAGAVVGGAATDKPDRVVVPCDKTTVHQEDDVGNTRTVQETNCP